MKFSTVLNAASSPGAGQRRISALYVTSDAGHLVIATGARLTNVGNADLSKGDDFRIAVRVSTDQGDTWASSVYALDAHADGDPTAFDDPCLVADASYLYVFASSDRGLTSGQTPFTSLAPIAFSRATKAGGFVDWSAVTYIPSPGGLDTWNVSAGSGHYDAATDTAVVPVYGYKTGVGWRQWPLYKIGAGAWTLGQMLPAVNATADGEGEHRVIRSSDGYWYSIGRPNGNTSRRPLYRAATINGAWQAIPAGAVISDIGNNLGLCTTALNGREAWLYTSSGYPLEKAGPSPGVTALRRSGYLATSFSRGRSWRRVISLTTGGSAATAFCGYSTVAASDETVFAIWESDNYTTLRFLRATKAELGSLVFE